MSELGEGSAMWKEACGSVTARTLTSEDREEIGKWPGVCGGSSEAHKSVTGARSACTSTGEAGV